MPCSTPPGFTKQLLVDMILLEADRVDFFSSAKITRAELSRRLSSKPVEDLDSMWSTWCSRYETEDGSDEE